MSVPERVAAGAKRMDAQAVALNAVQYRRPTHPVVVVCVDGGDPAYFEAAAAAGAIPTIERFMRTGFSTVAHCVIPSFTCPNNISIATGSPPRVHGISGNFYLDRATGEAVVMTGPELMRSRTIFDVLSKAGARTVVVTAKDKLRQQLGKGLEVGGGNVCFSSQCADATTLAENGIDNALAFVGRPLPDMYSEELSLFVLDAGIRFLEQVEQPELMYLSLTDYVQHKFAPEHPAAIAFYAALDERVGRLEALGATVALVADHGMSDKCRPDGGYNIIYLQDRLDERFGTGRTKVICPITDAFVGHHGSLGGFVRVYCFGGLDAAEAIAYIETIEGVEMVLEREETARRFDLPPDVEGDIAVISRGDYCIGMRRVDHDLSELKGERLRTHGGLSEQRVPFILSRPLSAAYAARARARPPMNYEIYDYALNGTA